MDKLSITTKTEEDEDDELESSRANMADTTLGAADESSSKIPLERMNSSSASLEANAHALKRRMESIKSQNAERRQLHSLTSSQVNSLNPNEAAEVVVKQSGDGETSSELDKLRVELQACRERERAYTERESAYVEQIRQVEEENEKFQLIAVEFEQIFHLLVKDKEASEAHYQKEILELTKERDQLQEDVLGIERSFDDLHRRFENLKVKVVEFKKARKLKLKIKNWFLIQSFLLLLYI